MLKRYFKQNKFLPFLISSKNTGLGFVFLYNKKIFLKTLEFRYMWNLLEDPLEEISFDLNTVKIVLKFFVYVCI